jgi:hypothetical protein
VNSLYKICLELFEEGKATDSKISFFTISSSLVQASNYVQREVVAFDEPEKEFEWRVVDASLVEGALCIPTIPRIAPDLDQP